MSPKSKKPTLLALLLSAILLITAACQGTAQPGTPQSGSGTPPAVPVTGDTPAAPGEASPQPTETLVPIVHNITPGSPPISFESQIIDTDTSPVAAQHGANGGESYLIDRFERPFDQSMNTYFPDLDVTHAALNRDETWFYVTITLAGQDPTGGGFLQDYGVELDLNQDGRGDTLVMAAAPGKDWTTDGVRVWQDANHDVGSANPLDSDAPTNGNGYETVIIDQGRGGLDPDVAWARISPVDSNNVQLAFKRSLISDSSRFLWGVWAIAPEMLHPDWFDYNDHFTQAEAGSSLLTLTQYYPLKAFYEADNTCRWAVGFTPTGSEPGICPVPATPTPAPTLTATPTPTPTDPLPGNINGTVFYDSNNNGKWNPLHDSPIDGAIVRVRDGSCGSPGIVSHQTATQPSGHFSLNVPPGIYCVDVSPDPTSIAWNQKSPPFSVNVHSGDSVLVNFWYREALH